MAHLLTTVSEDTCKLVVCEIFTVTGWNPWLEVLHLYR